MDKLAILLIQATLLTKVEIAAKAENISSGLSAFINDEVCPPGRYAFNDTYITRGINCIPCSEDSYKTDYGNMDCDRCPGGSRTNKRGATDPSDCVCSPGLFLQEIYPGEVPTTLTCSKCPSGGDCQGYRNDITPRPGYWLDKIPIEENATRLEILDCFGYQRCLGTSENECAEGWGGNLCSLCAFDNGNKDSGKYFTFFGACKRCYSTVVNVLLHLAVYLSWILLNLFVAEQYTVISLAIDWMQLMSIIGYINTGWPQSVSWFLNIARFFSFDLDVVSWQCISSWNFFWETLLQFSLPFALSLFWIILLCPVILGNLAHRRRNKLLKSPLHKRGKLVQLKKSKVYKSGKDLLSIFGFLDYFHKDINWNFLKAKVLVSFEATYVISTFYALSSLSYRTIGGKKVIFGAPYYEASAESLILGILGLLFLSIGFPCFMFLRCMSFQPKDDEDPGRFVETRVQETYQWFYSRFRIGKWKLAACGFIHRFAQISAVVFIRDAGMALNVSFVLNLLFGLFVGLQHPNISLKLNAIEYLTMLSTVATLLCGMWFNWINVSTGASINTSRALRTESWGDVWLNDLVEICALVNLGLTCLLFLYAALLEFIDVRCLSKSRAVLRQLLKERSSSNRRGLHYAHQGYLNSGEILLKYLSPITLRSWVDKIQMECEDEVDEKKRLQLLSDFGDTCYALSKFIRENPRHDPFSLSKDSVLWRKFLSHHPGILSMLLYGSDDLKRSFIKFFKEYFSLYWEPSRRSMARFVPTFLTRFKFLKCIGYQSEREVPQSYREQDLDPFDDLYNEKADEIFAKIKTVGICNSCKAQCLDEMKKCFPNLSISEGNSDGSGSCSSNGSSQVSTYKAFCSLDEICRGITAKCVPHLCKEEDAVDFMKHELSTRMENPDFSADPSFSVRQDCPKDISVLFSRRYRAPVAFWLASLSFDESNDTSMTYTRRQVERHRFVSIVSSMWDNTHMSGLHKFARFVTLGSLSPFPSSSKTKEGKNIDNVLPGVDINFSTCSNGYKEIFRKPSSQTLDADEHV